MSEILIHPIARRGSDLGCKDDLLDVITEVIFKGGIICDSQ